MPRHDRNTYIACRPGLQSTLRTQFPDVLIEVDNTITSSTGYEFRKRELTPFELMEEEVVTETLLAADPKNATTVIVPLLYQHPDNDEDVFEVAWYVVIRAKDSRAAITNALRGVKPVLDDDHNIEDGLTLGAIKDALSDKDIQTYSISLADGLVWLNVKQTEEV